MPQPPLLQTEQAAVGKTLWRACEVSAGIGSLEGAAFDEDGLRTMRRALDDVCGEVAPRAAPAEREFIAWLIVRLCCHGVRDDRRLKSAALAALNWQTPHGCAL